MSAGAISIGMGSIAFATLVLMRSGQREETEAETSEK